MITLSDNGWGALVAWLAGPQRTHRVPWVREGTEIVVTVERPRSGAAHRHIARLSAADVAGIDDDTDSYLTDAGAPPRPRGFAWRLLLPPRIASENEFWSALNVGLDREAPDAQHPLDHAVALTRILVRLYAAEGSLKG
jgi:hypothetical protein